MIVARLLVITAIGASASACAVTPSHGLDTSDIWARYIVAHQGDGTVIAQAILRAGGPTGAIVDLTYGDYLEVNGAVMTEWIETVTNYQWSRATVPVTPDGAYEIVFVRRDEEVSTTVFEPALPRILGTEPADVVRQLEPLTVRWETSPADDGIEVRVEGDCVSNVMVANLPDTGSYTTAALQASGAAADCEIDVRVVRSQTRGIDGAFLGGWSEAYRLDATSMYFDAIGAP